ncbi:restriction endonuclease subunit S [Macrococcoides goetzii]|uniref:restriction endonuclease subunit S n=1 Tax=Macrococcus sp. PK TaxID=2801919 RepID=UPI001F0F2D08|nr:restriction endonuclease subunit S [Macrococcus sp. PK]MCH4984481.1 restriction endonuclease subunit S [Macrococcus sp. PK]
MRLDDILNVYGGSIISRIIDYGNIQDVPVYDHKLFSFDAGKHAVNLSDIERIAIKKNAKVRIIKEGDIIINLASGECVIASNQSDGAILPYNYSIIELNDEVEADFFVGWFNFSKEALSQIDYFHQLSGSTDKKITHQMIKDITINLPSSKIQTKIAGLVHTNREAKKHFVIQNLYFEKFLEEHLFDNAS